MISTAQLTIGAGDSLSGPLVFQQLRHVGVLTIHAPAVLDALVFTVEVTAAREPGAGDWGVLEDAGGDVVVVAGKARTLPAAAFAGLRISASGNVAADRVFGITLHDSTI